MATTFGVTHCNFFATTILLAPSSPDVKAEEQSLFSGRLFLVGISGQGIVGTLYWSVLVLPTFDS